MGIVVNSACLGIIANQVCFETGCFIYNLKVLQAESLNCEHYSKHNNVTKHKLAGSKPCCSHKNVILNQK